MNTYFPILAENTSSLLAVINNVSAFWVTMLIFAIGFICSFLPFFPGSFIVWLGILVHKLWVPEYSVTWRFFWIATFLMVVAQCLDLGMTYWGSRRFGASWRGGFGAVVGGVIGIFLPPPLLWLIIGPIVGATLGELTHKKPWREATRAGFGSFVGSFFAYVIKIGISVALILGFFLSRNPLHV